MQLRVWGLAMFAWINGRSVRSVCCVAMHIVSMLAVARTRRNAFWTRVKGKCSFMNNHWQTVLFSTTERKVFSVVDIQCVTLL